MVPHQTTCTTHVYLTCLEDLANFEADCSNASDLVLTSHHRAVASASLVASPPQNTPSSPLSDTPAAPTDDSMVSTPDPALVQTKQPCAWPVLCDQPTIDNDTDLTKVLNNAPKPKKAKMTPD